MGAEVLKFELPDDRLPSAGNRPAPEWTWGLIGGAPLRLPEVANTQTREARVLPDMTPGYTQQAGENKIDAAPNKWSPGETLAQIQACLNDVTHATRDTIPSRHADGKIYTRAERRDETRARLWGEQGQKHEIERVTPSLKELILEATDGRLILDEGAAFPTGLDAGTADGPLALTELVECSLRKVSRLKENIQAAKTRSVHDAEYRNKLGTAQQKLSGLLLDRRIDDAGRRIVREQIRQIEELSDDRLLDALAVRRKREAEHVAAELDAFYRQVTNRLMVELTLAGIAYTRKSEGGA